MPKLYFRYGTMNSSKTANLIMVAHNYKSQGREVVLIKPSLDTRSGETKIFSRALASVDADIVVEDKTDINEAIAKFVSVDCILVDEVQFLSKEHIDQLRLISLSIPVICYGLRTDYKLNLFPGSKRLMELADTIEEIKTVCVCCHRKAIVNCKFYVNSEGKKMITKEGSDEPDIGFEDKYQPMCWACYNN